MHPVRQILPRLLCVVFAVCTLFAVPTASAHEGNNPHTENPVYYFGKAKLTFDLDADVPNNMDWADRITYYNNQVGNIPNLRKGECENTTGPCLNVQIQQLAGGDAIKWNINAFSRYHGWIRFDPSVTNESWTCTGIWAALGGHPHSGAGCSSLPHPAGVLTLTQNAEDCMTIAYGFGFCGGGRVAAPSGRIGHTEP